MMTIDEVIAHEREGADIARGNIIKCNNIGGYESWHNSECIKRAEEHEQIAEWLEELKDHRERECNHINEALYDNDYSYGYNKAIDEAIEIVKGNYRMEALEKLEQLKAGVEND